jgi:hypothetical protein
MRCEDTPSAANRAAALPPQTSGFGRRWLMILPWKEWNSPVGLAVAHTRCVAMFENTSRSLVRLRPELLQPLHVSSEIERIVALRTLVIPLRSQVFLSMQAPQDRRDITVT